MWSRDGRELFYMTGTGDLMGVTAAPRPTLQLSPPARILIGPFARGGNQAAAASYDVSLDGQRFLMIKPGNTNPPPPSSVVVVLNWAEELRLRP